MTSNSNPPLRVYLAGLAHETNSFSPLPTSLRSFEADLCYRAGDETARAAALVFPGYGDAAAAALARGHHLIEGPCFWTQPSGPVSAALFETLLGEILAGLRGSWPIDMVVLNLHGAMVAQGIDDCEAVVLRAVREAVGPSVPVGAILDLHGNVSAAMIESGAILVGVKEYPHIDYGERVQELFAILEPMASGRSRPSTALRTIPQLSLQGTTEAPMRALVAHLHDLERRAGVLSASLMHGFPWADWEGVGASVILVSEGLPRADVEAMADEVAERFTRLVEASPPSRLGVEAALDEAMATARPGAMVVIADSADNPGGGAACDSTYLLRAMIARDVQNAAVGMIWDPQAASIAADAGVGSRIPLRVGGKVGPLSGDPVDVIAEVTCVRDDLSQRLFGEDPASPLGLAVALRVGGIDLVVNSVRQQVFSPECFTGLGVDLTGKALVALKSSQHFRARFDRLARGVVYCDPPGSLSTDLAAMPYRRVRLAGRSGGATLIDRPVGRWWAEAQA
ncbi:M81 family metallopeptidase [Phenylobacterium sp. LjRoot164]|uniref:M81 family metallopeptidase n=1 Tax=unclassified Phenylobacterium TaxID=2640670 RepID=UPI003ED0FA94